MKAYSKLLQAVVAAATLFSLSNFLYAAEPKEPKDQVFCTAPAVTSQGLSESKVFFEYLPVPDDGSAKKTAANGPDIKDRFLAISKGTNVIDARDVERTLYDLLGEYYVRTGEYDRAVEMVSGIKDISLKLFQGTGLIRALLEAGDLKGAEKVISSGIKATNPMQEDRDFFISGALLELKNRGQYDIARNIPIQKGLMGDADNECLQLLCLAAAYADEGDTASSDRELAKVEEAISGTERMSVLLYVALAEIYQRGGQDASARKYFKEAFATAQKDQYFEFIAVRAVMAGQFELVKKECKTVWDPIKGMDSKAVSDACMGVAEYFQREGDGAEALSAVSLAQENAVKISDLRERMSVLTRIAMFYAKDGNNAAASEKAEEVCALFRKQPMRTLGYLTENAVYLSGLLERTGPGAAGSKIGELIPYLLEMSGNFQTEGRRNEEKIDPALVMLAERSFDLARYDDMAAVFKKMSKVGTMTEAVRYMVEKDPDAAKERLSRLVEEMLKTADAGGLSPLDNVDAHVTAAVFYSGVKNPKKASVEISVASDAMAKLLAPNDLKEVIAKNRLSAHMAEVYASLGDIDTANRIIDGIIAEAVLAKSAEGKKSLASAAIKALARIYGGKNNGDQGPYVSGKRYREYSRMYW